MLGRKPWFKTVYSKTEKKKKKKKKHGPQSNAKMPMTSLDEMKTNHFLIYLKS